MAEERVISDPRAIRALAHPARITVLNVLLRGRSVTATELAELVGLTPSAMSYHLRALERYGLIERAEPAGDGRERRWQRVPVGWRIESAQPEITAPAEAALIAGFLDQHRSDVLSFIEAGEPGPWRDAGTLSRSVRWLTVAQLEAVAQEFRDVLDRFPDTDPGDPQARPVAITTSLFPVAEPGESTS